MAPRCAEAPLEPLLGTNYASRRLVLVTCHRRENLGVRMKQVGKALAGLARKHPDVLLLLPAHPNPSVRSTLCPPLRALPNVIICDPLPYDLFLACLHRACFLISDSGGVQEEATALGKPVLVLLGMRPNGRKASARLAFGS